MLVKIAWRNIWRNKLRSIVVILSIAVGLTAGAFYFAFSLGMIEEHISSSITSQLSHIQVHHSDFKKDQPGKTTIEDGMTLVEKINQDERVKASTGRVLVSGMVSSSRANSGVSISGVIPEMEDEVTGLASKLVDGAYFEGVKKNPVIIGQKLAEKLKVELKSHIILTFENSKGEFVQGRFKIVGLYKTKHTMFDETNVYARMEDIQNILGSDRMNEIAVLLNNNEDLEPTKASIAALAPNEKVETWKEYASELNYMISSTSQYLYIFMFIILLALLFGIINTMLMAVLERVKELGMLMSIGLNKVKVFTMIVIETVFLALVGGPLGILISYILIAYFHVVGLDLSNFSGAFESMGFSSIIYPNLAWNYYLEIALLAIFTALIGALYPAWKALQLNPSEAIRKI